MLANLPLPAFALSANALWICLPFLLLAVVITEWLPKQVITNPAGDRMVPAQAAIAANSLASFWLALMVLVWLISSSMDADPRNGDNEFGFQAILIAMISGLLVSVTVVPIVVSALAIPTVCLLLRPAEWIVSQISMRNPAGKPTARQSATTIAALLAFASGTILSVVIIILALFDPSSADAYLPMQLTLAPFGLLSWLAARVIATRNCELF